MENPRRSPLRQLALPGVVIVLFWLAAQVVSGIPPLHVLATSVDGLVLADYRQDPLQALGMAPLSGQIYSDAYRDALSGPRGVSWVWFGETSASAQAIRPTSGAGTQTPSTAPTATGSPSASASPNPSSMPTPTGTLPTAASSAGPSPTASPSGTATVTPTPAPTATNTGTFTGRVIDWNTNSGIPGATLSLSPGGPTTTTDGSGSFTESAPAGTYTVTASASGYASQSQTISIKAGSKTTASIWLIPSSQAGIVHGKVFDSATGLPIAGASVYINVPGLGLYTDAYGNYSFTGLPAGSKTVSASATNYTSSNSSCSVTAGQVTILNIKLVHR